jgi:hypothetical protein
VRVIGSGRLQDATGDCVDICESENDRKCKTSPRHRGCQTLPGSAETRRVRAALAPRVRRASAAPCVAIRVAARGA